MKKLIFLLFLSLSLSAFGQNQSSSKQAQKAYLQAGQAISAKFYDQAISYLKQAISIDHSFTAAYQQLGDIYRKLGDYSQAKSTYKKLLEIQPDFTPLTYFGLAESELNTGDYADALQHFKKYLSTPGLAVNSLKMVNKYIADCEFAMQAVKHPVDFNPQNLGPAVNTAEQEYLPVFTADEETLIFTRQANKNEDFYKSRKQQGQWTTAEYLSRNINTSVYNEGAQCISPDGMYMFFTGCNRPEGLGRCDIYLSKREGKNWSAPFNIGGPVNTKGWESQPSLSADGRTLYFVSTRAGGMGGYDIWRAYLNADGSWSVPENLGPTVNTPYDEQSPFIHPDDQTLYFSSNGWPGLGNKDIFMSRKTLGGDKWQKPENLGYPINTYGEESGLTVSNDGKTAFFSSDKQGGYGGLDLYSFTLPASLRPAWVTYVKGVVFDHDNKEMLTAQVQIVNLQNNKTIYNDQTDSESGEFLASMPAGGSYLLNVSKEGYLFYSQNFKPDTASNQEPFHIQVPLQKIRVGGMVVLNNIFFESNKYELLPESKSELMQLVNFLNNNPQVAILISGHTDNIGNDSSNQLLSENRAKAVYKYLIENKINASRLSFKGFGESRPVGDNHTAEGRGLNRRTEFSIIKIN